MSGQPAPTSGAYNHPTAAGQATRQIIDSPLTPLSIIPLTPAAELPILPSSTKNTSQDPSSANFKPQVFRRSSTNYEDADAAARQAKGAPQQHSLEQTDVSDGGRRQDNDKMEERRDSGVAGAALGWKPQYGRTQSWDKQDWKHALQMGEVVGTQKVEGDMLGFSEKGENDVRFSQS